MNESSIYKNNLSDINGSLRPGIVHRIDKETSGLLVIAKNNIAHAKLGKQFSDHTIKRKYECLIWGVIRPLNGKIETLITRNKRNRQLMTVSEINGKRAVTNYKTIKVFKINEYTPGKAINLGVKKSKNETILILSGHSQITKLNLKEVKKQLKEYVAIFGNQNPIYKGKKISKR